jgi:hypothetical protein
MSRDDARKGPTVCDAVSASQGVEEAEEYTKSEMMMRDVCERERTCEAVEVTDEGQTSRGEMRR